MPKRNLIWITGIIAVALVTLWVTRKEPAPPLPIEGGEFEGVAGTYRLIKQRYYLPIDASELRTGAVNGMVSKLDEFSTYVSPGEQEAFSSRMLGVDRGLGLRLEQANGAIRVIGPLPNSPAHEAGIAGGDLIRAIDGRQLNGIPLTDVEELLKGEFGTSVTLTVERTDGREKTFTLTRDEFPIESVQGLYRELTGQWVYMIEPEAGLGYVRIKEFVRGTTREFREILVRMDGLRGLILDVRDNPGGMLSESVATADLLIRKGVIATSSTRNRQPKRYVAQGDGTFSEFPLVVLINAKTASAAEIVAGALSHHGRAVLLGTRTRGKGTVQTMFALQDHLGQINLTTSQLLVGPDTVITRTPGSDEWGIDPHDGMEVIVRGEIRKKLRQLRRRAEVLDAPIATTAPTGTTATKVTANPMHERFMRLDQQLALALDLLKKPKEIERILQQTEMERGDVKKPSTQQTRTH